jgi:capsular polysaccharide export protein
MNHVLVLIESQKQYNFFRRCQSSFESLSFRLEFVTSLYSVYLRSIRNTIPCSLPMRPRKIQQKDFSQCGELQYGLFTQDQANEYYSSFAEQIEKTVSAKTTALALLWGGGDTVASCAMIDQCRLNSIPILYIDRANIPGKIFADPKGMNFNSELYQNISLLDGTPAKKELFDRYQKEFISMERQGGGEAGNNINWFLPLDILYSYFIRLPFRGEARIWKKLHETVIKNESKFGDNYDITKGSFIFVPLNHSFEIRKENKDYGPAEEIIKCASFRANEQQLDVVVKFHPAENDQAFLSFINALKAQYRFFIRQDDSRTLLLHAHGVVASNTSVALEAMLLNRPVLHFAKSLYREMNHTRLVNYVTSYLMDVDTTSSDQIPVETITKFLTRAHVK